MIPFINIVNAEVVFGDASSEVTLVSDAPSGLIPACAIGPDGADSLDCVIQLFINISDVLFTVLGSLMLIVFVYGGLLYLFSQGDQGKLSKAFGAIKGGLVGLAIVIGAFTAVTFIVNTLRDQPAGLEIESQYVTCGTEKTPENNGQACAPAGFSCNNGGCVDDNIVLQPAGSQIIIDSTNP